MNEFDYRSGRLPKEQVDAETVRRAAQVAHIRKTIEAITQEEED